MEARGEWEHNTYYAAFEMISNPQTTYIEIKL